MKNRVICNEKFVALAVAAVLKVPSAKPKKKPQLAIDLEWFLTWKLKTGCCPSVMWCDGLGNLKVKKIGRYRIAIKSDIRIGPENDSGHVSKGTLLGEIEVRHTAKKLKSYLMVIHHENAVYAVKKA